MMWIYMFFQFLLVMSTKTEEMQLKLVQLVFRHGDRSPTNTFPTDLWKNVWTDGLGQLTKLGIQQQFDTGEYLSNQYGKLINNTYNCNTLYVRSTNVDRTLMSAYANLAGFIPPQGRHIWNENITWQPIPVHTLPEKDDYLLSSNAECPKYDTLFAQQMMSSEARAINLKYDELYKFLTNKTGIEINDFHNGSEIYDTLLVEQIHNLTLPEWANETVLSDLKDFKILHFIWMAKTQEMRRLRGGSLVGEFVKNMETSVSNKTDQHKIYMFSAHDDTIIHLLSALDVFDAHIPPYRSMILLELLEMKEIYYVKILYRNDTTRSPYELTLKECLSPCPLDQFIQLTASVIPTDIKFECLI